MRPDTIKRSIVPLLVVIAGSGVGVSQAEAAESATIQAVLSPNGSGEMVVNSQTNPSTEVWTWESCKQGNVACRPFAVGRIVSTAGADPDSVFRVSSNYGATTVSPVWHGTATAVKAPSVQGVVRANELITPLPGVWSGGWEGGGDSLQLAVAELATSPAA